LAGLAVVAEHAGKVLLGDPEAWEGRFVWCIMKDDGEIPRDSMAFLEKRAEGNIYIKAYLDDVKKQEMKEKKCADKRLPPTYQEITKQIYSSEKCKYFPRIEQISDADLTRLATDFQQEKDNVRLIKYLRLFCHVKYPLDYKDILEVVYGKDGEVRSWAIRALRHFNNPDIRRLIDMNFQTGQNWWETFDLLEVCYQPSDCSFMETALLKEQDEFGFHSMGLSLEEIFRKFDDAGLVDLMIIVYQKGHCALCRCRLIESLIASNRLPDWIAHEALYDCSMDTRALVKSYLEKRGTKALVS
jgi:hypothetical protein